MAIQQEYKHSGALGSAAVLVPVVGSLGALVLSFLYGYISVYNPVVGYISFLVTGAFVFGLVAMLFALARAGKCRNPGFMAGMGGLVGLVALYASWVVFVYALINRYSEGAELNLLFMFLAPQAIWEIILEINQSGWFSIRSWTPTGVVLWIFWGIEALIIVVAPLILGAVAISDKVFCERCTEWCKAGNKFQLRLSEDGGVLEKLATDPLSTLESLERADANEYPRLDVSIHACATCTKTAAYKVALSTYEVDDEGKGSEKNTDVTELLLLSVETRQRLEAIEARPVEALPTADAEPDPTTDAETLPTT